jgi:hypothetical protein
MMRALVLLVLSAGCSPDPVGDTGTPGLWTYTRHYESGRQWGYTLTTTHSSNGVLDKEEVGEVSHTVNAAADAEDIVWTGLSLVTPDGEAEDLSEDARAVPPYSLSLSPSASMTLPELVVPSMSGMVTDHFTYYVAVSPSLGVQDVHEVGDVATGDAPVLGEWSDDEQTPVGQDCIHPALELLTLDEGQNRVEFESRFAVPAVQDCFEWVVPEWASPVVEGQVNNFQQVKIIDGQAFAMYGVEWFTIRSQVELDSGRVTGATMDNQLGLRILAGCDDEWANCALDDSLLIVREEVLQLVDNE